MNYGELRSHFKELLNRSDCTDPLADRFISSGLRRIERVLRTPFQRTSYTFIVPSDWDGKVTIPSNYLGLHELLVRGEHCPRVTHEQGDLLGGFSLSRGSFVFYDTTIAEGDEIIIEYYAEFDKDVTDETITAYTMILSDCVVYAALIFACTYFVDVRKAEFEKDFAQIISEVQLMADIDEMSGSGMVMTPYGGDVA